MEKQYKNTFPIWIAATVTALLVLPLGLFLGPGWNAPLWVSFVVWAQYFMYGAQPSALKIMWPNLAAGAALTTIGLWIAQLLSGVMNFYVATFVGVAIAVFLITFLWERVPLFGKGTLAYFNGMSLMFAVLFTGSFPFAQDPSVAPLMKPIIACLWCILWACFGGIVGWLNVFLGFAHEVKPSASSTKAGPVTQ